MSKFNFKTKPMSQQQEALDKSHTLKYFAFFMEAGTGKSKIMLDEARWAYDTGRINVMFIVCPNGIQQNWILDQVPEHLAGEYAAAYYSSGMKADERKEWEAAIATTDKLRVLAINYDQLLNKKQYEWIKKFFRANDVLMVLDESHDIKTPSAKRTRACINLGEQAIARRIATGTPAPNGPMDLYSQLKFLSPDITGHSTYTGFKAEHAIIQRVDLNVDPGTNKRDYFDKIIGYRGLKELDERIAPFIYRKKLRDCVDLPDLIHTNFYVQLSPQQDRMYKELKAMAATSIKDSPEGMTADQRIIWYVDNVDVMAQNVLTKLVRMQQTLAGYVKDDDGTIHAIENNRVADLVRLIESIDGKIIIWCQGTTELEAIAERLSKQYKVATYYGKTKQQARTEARISFQEGDVRIFIGQPRAGGVGITLTAAAHMIWYTTGYSLKDYMQAQGRFERIGQTQNMVVHHMVSRGTLDTKILRVLESKRKTQERLIWGNQ